MNGDRYVKTQKDCGFQSIENFEESQKLIISRFIYLFIILWVFVLFLRHSINVQDLSLTLFSRVTLTGSEILGIQFESAVCQASTLFSIQPDQFGFWTTHNQEA